MKNNNMVELLTNKMRTIPCVSINDDMYLLGNLDDKDRDGRTLLINAAFYKRHDIMEWLIVNGANVNICDNQGNTALHAAVQKNNILAVQLLLTNGADVNKQNVFGNNPLWIITPRHSKELITLLLEHGANPYLKNNFGVSPLDRMAAYPAVQEIYLNSISLSNNCEKKESQGE